MLSRQCRCVQMWIGARPPAQCGSSAAVPATPAQTIPRPCAPSCPTWPSRDTRASNVSSTTRMVNVQTGLWETRPCWFRRCLNFFEKYSAETRERTRLEARVSRVARASFRFPQPIFLTRSKPGLKMVAASVLLLVSEHASLLQKLLSS